MYCGVVVCACISSICLCFSVTTDVLVSESNVSGGSVVFWYGGSSFVAVVAL